MKRKNLVRLGLCLLFAANLTACSPSEPRNLAEGQKRAMEKAQAVEDQLKDAAVQQRETIEEQSR